MKVLNYIALSLLIAPSLPADTISKSEEVELLRQEIRKQEIVLKVLKEKLEALEEKEEHTLEEKEEHTLVISVSEEGLQAGGKTVSLDGLEKVLKELPDDAKIIIRADRSVSFKKVVSVMELCKKAGLNNYVFATL